MDSLTQLALGATIGEATLGHRVGRKAALWGAVCGTLPDLDVLVPFGDPVATFTYHRSFSHSLFVLAALAPLMVWLIRKLHPADAGHRAGWYALVALALLTHPLLDAVTIYGTQIFWPFVTTPIGLGSIFIIDPAFTLPLIVGLIGVAVLRHAPGRARRLNVVTLSISLAYLGWSLVAQFHARGVAETSLAAQGIRYERLVALAGPFTTILWRFIAIDDRAYYVGWYSMLDPDDDVVFARYDSDPALLADIGTHWPVARLRWFTKGFYRVHAAGGEIVMTDLRMGVEGNYVFGFKVGEIGNPHAIPTPAELRSNRPDLSAWPVLWNRILGRTELTL